MLSILTLSALVQAGAVEGARAAPESANAAQSTPGSASDESVVSLTPSFGVAGRHFDYADPRTQGLRSYDVLATPVLGIAGDAFPLARSGVPLLRGLGAYGEYGAAVGLVSERGSDTVNAGWSRFDVGARYRLPVTPTIVLGARGGYGGTSFRHDGHSRDANAVSTSYRFVRMGADARIKAGPVWVSVGVDALLMTDLGEVGGRFPHASAIGATARLGASAKVVDHIEVGMQAAYERVAFHLNPEPGDPHVAGGLLDAHWRVEPRVTFFY